MKIMLFGVLAALLLAGGCTSQQTLADAVIQARQASREGVTRVYPVSAQQAWNISKAVFRWIKVDSVEEHRDGNYMIASSGMDMAVFGTVMGVWIEPVKHDATRITVIYRDRGDCCQISGLTVERFYAEFEQGMTMVKSGRKLPDTAP